MTLIEHLIAALESERAELAGITYTHSRNIQTRKDTTNRRRRFHGDATWAAYIQYGGRRQVGSSRFSRPVWQVVVLVAPMDSDDPWLRADEAADTVIKLIHSELPPVDGVETPEVPDAFADLLPTLPAQIKPQGAAAGFVASGGKSFAAVVVQVVGA